MPFENRIEAGRKLAELLTVPHPEKTVVLTLPRGGIPLAIEISKKFNLPLDVVLAKKIGHPMQPEFAIGAITEQGETLLNPDVSVASSWIEDERTRLKNEIKQRREKYSNFITKQKLEGKEIILVDDGIATGMTMFAAIKALKKENVKKITVAVPVIPKDTYLQLQKEVDQVVAVKVPEQFLGGIGAYYRDFTQVSDQEVQRMLGKHFEY